MLLHPGPAAKAPIVTTIALGLATLLASLGTSIANIALPSVAADLSVPFVEVQAVVVAYLVALTVAVLIAGRLGDRWGLKRMLQAGVGVFLVAALGCAVAPNLTALVVSRAIQGVGAAFMTALSMALLRQAVDHRAVGRAMGLLGTMSAVGTTLGPSLGGLLISAAGWRGIFLAQVPLATATLLAAHVVLPSAHRHARQRPPDVRSVLTKTLAVSLVVNLLVAGVMMTTLVVGPFYLRLSLDLPPATAGLVMAVGPAMSVALGVLAGHSVDVWGHRRTLLLGLALMALGALLLGVLSEGLGVFGYVAAIAVLTPGYQLFQAANNTEALANVSVDGRGTVSGLLGFSRNVGLAAGAGVMGAIFAFAAGTADFTRATPQAIANGTHDAFLVACGLMLAALALASSRQAAAAR